MNHLQNFLHIKHNLTQNLRKTCLCGGDINAMHELDKQNKQKTLNRKKSCSCMSFLLLPPGNSD
jgi:hypothetical protein